MNHAPTSDHKKFVILLFTTLVGIIFIILTDSLSSAFRLFALPRFHALYLAAFCTSVIALMGMARPSMQFIGKDQFGIPLSKTIGLVYIFDLAGICYLIYFTGGLATSPFSSFLFILPTNGIFLGESFLRVRCYYIGVIIPAGILAFMFHDTPISTPDSNAYKAICFAAMAFVFMMSLLGLWMRTKLPNGDANET